jgi:cytochrome P450
MDRNLTVEAEAAAFSLHNEEIMQDPYPVYDRLRSACPVGRSSQFGGFTFTTTYADTKEVYSNFRSFTSSQGASLPVHPMRLLPLEVDPPLQTKYRRLINPRFTPEAVAEKRQLVETVVEDLLDMVGPTGKSDLMSDIVRPALSRIVLPILGIPHDDQPFLAEIVSTITLKRSSDMALVETAFKNLIEYLASLVERRRSSAEQDDLIGTLIASSKDSHSVSTDEIVRILIVTLLGGLDTTSAVMGEALLHLIRNPSELDDLRSGKLEWPKAIEEFIRFTSPVQGMRRVATEDVDLHGVPVAAGCSVVPLIGAGNRDPGQFEEPDRCVLGRTPNDHLSFGAGAHICLGRHLARLEIEVMLKAIFDRLTGICLPSDFAPRYSVSEARGIVELPVEFALDE